MTGLPAARRVVVTGRVQGVWFRQSCADRARSAGVVGWVRNLRDGQVEAWLEGDPDQVDAVIDWCRVGPPRATVTGVDVREEDPVGATRFEVR
jgi:acylphosphatase